MKQDILDYLRYTPANTNVNVVSTMLDQNNEIPPEVSNAVETHGLGWTSEEEVEGFDIQWDGNTEGLEETGEGFYKIDSALEGIASKDDLVGATIVLAAGDQTFEEVLTDESLYTTDNKVYGCILSQFGGIAAVIAFDDGDIEEADVYSQGIWLVNTGDIHTSRFYKEATTEEVVHQIDQKYIPGGSSGNDDVFVVTFLFDENEEIQCDRTPDEITEAAKDKSIVGLLSYQEPVGDGKVARVVQTAVVSTWIPGFAEDFQFCAFNSDHISVLEIDYNDEEDAWTTREFKYRIEATSKE